jgi:biotin synthase
MNSNWTFEKVKEKFHSPFTELLYTAQTIHRQYFNPCLIQVSTLLSIKTGSCPENCTYCAQSSHHKGHIEKKPMMTVDEVRKAAQMAKAAGSTRLCMGAAGRKPNEQDLSVVCEMIKTVKELGLEACVTLGLLDQNQAAQLKEAGLDYYNHNIDTSPDYYTNIVTTRTFEDRLQTLEYVQNAGIKVCCGGILGMGETNEDRIKMLVLLANLKHPPESVPINKLIKIPGTPLENADDIDPFDFIRTIATARIIMPSSYVRLSAGRESMSDESQTLCFLAGANSIFYGEKLLTVKNARPEKDELLFQRLGLKKI